MAATFFQSNKEIFDHVYLNGETCGLLIGLETLSQVDTVVVGLHNSTKCHLDKINNQIVHLPELDENCIARHYPAGCSFVGIWLRYDNEVTDTVKAELEQILNRFYKHCVERIVVVAIVTDSPDSNSHHSMYYHRNNSNSVLMEGNNVSRVIPKTTVCVRLKAPFTLYQTMSNDPIDCSQLDSFRNIINKSTLWIPESQTPLNKESITLDSLNLTSHIGLVNVEMLQYSPEVVRPIAISLKPITSSIIIPIRLDIVGIFPASATVGTVTQQLKKKLLTQLETIVECIECFRSTAVVHHYMIPSQRVPVTVLYPSLPFNTNHPPTTNDSLVNDREKLHKLFCLPRNRPFFRLDNLHWPCNHDRYLINPHAGLHSLSATEYQIAMVTGFYAYRHYMQDKFNDDGWGCAYRSLQTIWSWFQFQGYTDLESPTHTEIQETLVDCGDKQRKFIGSKEWIGSFEVSTVLNHKLQIDSRIHQCPSGSEMLGMGPTLLRHFQTEGTPIMIGGGVLAHTIIGVAYNRDTGTIKFLILDPHYTGKDELKFVLGKGCDWKNVNFWDSTASYNLCLPIKPNEI